MGALIPVVGMTSRWGKQTLNSLTDWIEVNGADLNVEDNQKSNFASAIATRIF